MSEVSHGVESVQVAQPQQEGIVVSKPVARVMMLVNAIVWGTGYTMLKHAQDNMPTQWLMFFRMGAATFRAVLHHVERHVRTIRPARLVGAGGSRGHAARNARGKQQRAEQRGEPPSSCLRPHYMTPIFQIACRMVLSRK